jgi:hypothetical protein
LSSGMTERPQPTLWHYWMEAVIMDQI